MLGVSHVTRIYTITRDSDRGPSSLVRYGNLFGTGDERVMLHVGDTRKNENSTI